MINNLLMFKNKSVLFAEDDDMIRAHMSGILVMLFGEVHLAADGEEAYQLYNDKLPDIILTDIKMPKVDGLDLIKKIRMHNYDIPIILLSGYSEQSLLIDVADLSIDGYLQKPTQIGELTHAVCKAIQRTHSSTQQICLSQELLYNLATKELYYNGSVIVLGVKEQELLQLLINNRHKTVTKKKIKKTLWPDTESPDSAVKSIVLRLRKKLGIDIIISVRGIGYRLNINAALQNTHIL